MYFNTIKYTITVNILNISFVKVQHSKIDCSDKKCNIQKVQHVQILNTCNKIKNQYYPIEYNKNEICQGKLKKRNNKVFPRVP